jgi:beta-glucanase (GH16 family)
MKTILLLISLLISILISSCNKDIHLYTEYKYSYETGELVYVLPDTTSKITIYNYDSTRIIATGKLKNGQKTSLWKEYYEDGQISTSFRYKNGKYQGRCKTWYRNGQLKGIWIMKNGVLDKAKSCFDPEGNKISVEELIELYWDYN